MSITVILIIITVLVSLGAFNSSKIMNDLIFYPPAVSDNNQYYRFITCGFIHADYGHLFFNMISFYFFGQFVENAFELMPRHALHAKSLGFVHPSTKENVFFNSELPADFSAVLEKWRKYIK